MSFGGEAVANGIAEKVADARQRILTELRKVIVGQDEVVEQMLIALFAGGHCLITGVPGLAKTLLVKTLAEILDLTFKRIQFTPDLMPADITGTEILDEAGGVRSAAVRQGADLRAHHPGRRDQPHAAEDAGRAARSDAGAPGHGGRPRHTRSNAVLRARHAEPDRAGRHVSAARSPARSLHVQHRDDYLSEDDEVRVVTETTSTARPAPARVLDGADILQIQDMVRQVLVADDVARYAVRLVNASRPGREGRVGKLDFVDSWVRWGAGLRASQALILGGKARALMHGRYHVSVADIRALAPPILRHRIITNFYAESEHVDCRRHRHPVARGGARPEERSRHVRTSMRVSRPGELRFLDPAVIARLATLELRARTIVEGFLSGLHRSPLKGFSASSSPSTGSTCPATISPRSTGRSSPDRIASSSSKHEEETNLKGYLLLDVSGSMTYGSGSLTKLRVRVHAGRLARVPDAAAARRRRARHVRRSRSGPWCLRASGRAISTRYCTRSTRLLAGTRTDARRPLAQLADAMSSSAAWSC